MEKEQSKDKIFLRFNNCQCGENCCSTGKHFKPEIPLAFFLQGHYGACDDHDQALEEGFTMTRKDFDELIKLAWLGMTSKDRDITF
jgi:hypothetical protein